MKAGINNANDKLFIGQKGAAKIEISCDEAIEAMAIWWEEMKKDGINVALEIQKARAKVRR